MNKSVKTWLIIGGVAVLFFALGAATMWGIKGCDSDEESTTTVPATESTVAGGETTTSIAGGAASAESLIGKWYNAELNETLEFTADGKMIWTPANGESQTFTYTVEPGTIVFVQPNAPEANRMSYTIENGKLVLADTKYMGLVYEKQ